MHLLLFLLHLGAAVVLLLYSTRMVRTGIERAAGASLRNLLMKTRRGRVSNILAGVLGAVFLQSSTAVALLVSGFAATGVMGVTASLAVVLGADLGTAIVVQFLSLDLSALIPAFLACGGILFLKFEARKVKQFGRVLIGIAFILLSLKMIGEATIPFREHPFLPTLVEYLGNDGLTALVGGAALTFVFHSSVAAILLFATLAGLGLLPVEAGIALVLGANIGGGLIAVWLTRHSHIKAKRIALGNLLMRASGALGAFVILSQVNPPYEALGGQAGQQLVNFHFLFNTLLVIGFLPAIAPVATLTKRLLKEAETRDAGALSRPSALLRDVLDHPGLALASATRELLRMSEMIEIMFTPVMDFFITSNLDEITRIRRMDEEVNAIHTQIKLYIAELNQRTLTSDQAQRGMQLTNFTISLERVGDIIAKDIVRLAVEKQEKGLSFSDEGWGELTRMHARVGANIQLALNVLVSDDLESARQLVREKEAVRALEQHSHDRHLERLGRGTRQSIATSDIHLETVRALKEINSCFVTFAYPVLSKYGELLGTRLANGDLQASE